MKTRSGASSKGARRQRGGAGRRRMPMLPVEQAMAMPMQRLEARPAELRLEAGRAAIVWRSGVFGAAGLLTAGFAYELYRVLSFGALTPIETVFLILSTIAFGWVALGSASATAGYFALARSASADTVEVPAEIRTPVGRTALLFPVYHEEPARIAATIQALAEDLERLGVNRGFDVFVLSDSRGPEAGEEELAVFQALARSLAGTLGVYYRQRPENTAKKAGNIADWVERFGGGYPYFVILDGDSVMSGEMVTRLALAMDAAPRAGLLQSVPRLVGGRSLFARLQQFAGAVYGPAVAAGLSVWSGGQGNYWGHNAIIRTEAFAAAAGLPELPGRAPFGGHIRSHDFVEAALLVKAGWGVHMVPSLEGSYEGCPPTLPDLIVRDRRWCQGNLQHIGVLLRTRLTAMSRVHLTMGVLSYLISAVWAATLVVGMVLTLQSSQFLPSYFHDGKTLFPIWPVIDPGAALRLFVATMAVVMLPKVLGALLELERMRRVGERGRARIVAGVLAEAVLSILLAPIFMVTQTVAVVQILMRHDSGWKPQRRDDSGIQLGDAARLHALHTLIGIGVLVACLKAGQGSTAWMAPIILGLSLSILLSWYTARPAGRVLAHALATREDTQRPAILRRTDELHVVWQERAERGTPEPGDEPLPRAA
ncbi:MAG: glucans biosynthesis glucosyltransferase MdoH [Hyphomicrobiaceae bacterium]